MESVAIGRGVSLTTVGLGGARREGRYQLGHLSRVSTDEQCAAAVDAAWRGGVRYFDTAPHDGLGLSERRLRALLSSYPRQEYTLWSDIDAVVTGN